MKTTPWAGMALQTNEPRTASPTWDPAYLDVPRFRKIESPEEAKADGTSAKILLFFHLPKSKCAKLKQLAMLTDGL